MHIFLRFFLFTGIVFSLSACGGPDMDVARQAALAGDHKTAAQNYQALADFGIPRAKTELGKMYLNGQGVNKDPEKARQLFAEAKRGGDKSASLQQNMARADITYAVAGLKRGSASERNAALLYLEQQAQAGNKLAAFETGLAYEKGAATPQNGGKAAYFYDIAGQLYYPKAYYYEAMLYKRGKLVKLDIKRAVRLFELAGSGGYLRGYSTLAEMYAKGDKVKLDTERAAYYKALAEL